MQRSASSKTVKKGLTVRVERDPVNSTPVRVESNRAATSRTVADVSIVDKLANWEKKNEQERNTAEINQGNICVKRFYIASFWLLNFDLVNDGAANDDAGRFSDVSSEDANDLSMDENAIDKILYPAEKTDWHFHLPLSFNTHYNIIYAQYKIKRWVILLHACQIIYCVKLFWWGRQLELSK